MRIIIFAAVLALFSFSKVVLAENTATLAPDASVAQPAEPIEPLKGLHPRWIDHHIDPAKNFYQFANGRWRHHYGLSKNNAIHEGLFAKVQERTTLQIEDIILGLIKTPLFDPRSDQQKIINFYLSGMDQTAIDQLGLQPLSEELRRIDSLKTQTDVIREIAHLQRIGVNAPFAITALPDFFGVNHDLMMASIGNGGLGLPDKIYYTDYSYHAVREAYMQHIFTLFIMLGKSPQRAAQAATTIMNMETAFAKALVLDDADMLRYMPIKVTDLPSVLPTIAWREYFFDLGYPQITTTIICHHQLDAVADALQQQSLQSWQDYFRWHLLHVYAPYLSQNFVNEDFHLTQAITGKKIIPARAYRVLAAEQEVFEWALAKYYIAQHFSPELKTKATRMVERLRSALRQDLSTLTWMSPEGRLAAIKKLDSMQVNVGYPDAWDQGEDIISGDPNTYDYSTLKIAPNTYLMNVMRANAWRVKKELDQIGQPFNRNAWLMPPQEVNAYYNPWANSITIPAGVLQKPLFDPNGSEVLNYARIGSVIGHEITHGFDNMGGLFDETGHLKPWLPEADQKNFETLAKCVTDQYSQFYVFSNNGQTDRVFEPGQKVTGEAIADLGGVALAYRALNNPLAGSQYDGQAAFKGYTQNQWFFLSVAQLWASKIHPEAQLLLLGVDTHPLPKFRVNGALANLPEFQQVFQIPVDARMAHNPQCVIW